MSSRGDTLDWAQISKQINHIHVKNSLAGWVVPDRQWLMGVWMWGHGSPIEKQRKKKLIWSLSLWLSLAGSARVLLVITQLSPQVLHQSSSVKPIKVSICTLSAWRTFINMSRTIHFNGSHSTFYPKVHFSFTSRFNTSLILETRLDEKGSLNINIEKYFKCHKAETNWCCCLV